VIWLPNHAFFEKCLPFRAEDAALADEVCLRRMKDKRYCYI